MSSPPTPTPVDFVALQQHAATVNYDLSTPPDQLGLITDDTILTAPFPYFVGTMVISLTPFRPSFVGYLMPTLSWAVLARQYESHLHFQQQSTSGATSGTTLYPLQPPLVENENEKCPINILTDPNVVTFIDTYKTKSALVYQTNNSPQAQSIYTIPTIHDVVQTHHNNQWFQYSMSSSSPITTSTLTMVYPADPWVIRKYTDQASILVTETPLLYNNVHLPIVRANCDEKKLGWLYDLLDGKKEQDTVVINDNDLGFVMAKDTKWGKKDWDGAEEWRKKNKGERGVDGSDDGRDDKLPLALSKPLWFLALPKSRHLRSIRDLTANDLPLLTTMRTSILTHLKDQYGFEPHDVILYCHYLPTFYHLHIHINHVSALTENTYMGKVEELDAIIANIELYGDYYPNCTRRVNVPSGGDYAKAWDAYNKKVAVGDVVGDVVGAGEEVGEKKKSGDDSSVMGE